MPNSNENENIFTWNGRYRAKVTDAKDPKKLGRVKVWIPDTMHELEPFQEVDGVKVSVNEGMWALPANNPIGGRNTNDPEGDHYYQGSCMIPPENSWVWIFFENGNPSEPRYDGACDLENTEVLPENRMGEDYHKKWTLYKTRMGRCIILSDDTHDERVEITGKKRLIQGGPSEDEESVYPIIKNQSTIIIDEREGQEKILIEDYKGNFLKFDIESEELHINFHDNITIHSDKSITLDAGEDINCIAGRNMKTLVGMNPESILGDSALGALSGGLLGGGKYEVEAFNLIKHHSNGHLVDSSLLSMRHTCIGPMTADTMSIMALLSQGTFNIQSNLTLALHGKENLLGSSEKVLGWMAGEIMSRDAPVISDNAGITPPVPTIPAPTILTIIDKSIILIIDELIISSISANIRDYLKVASEGVPYILKGVYSDLVEAYATKQTFETLAKLEYVDKVKEIAKEEGVDETLVETAYVAKCQEEIDKADKKIEDTEEKIDAAKDSNVGGMKDVDQDEIDKVKDDPKTVYDKDEAKSKIDQIKDKINEWEQYLTKPIYNNINSLLTKTSNYLNTNLRDDLPININNTINEFDSIIGSLDPAIDSVGVKADLNNALSFANNKEFEDSYKFLKKAENGVRDGIRNIDLKDVNIYRDISATADKIIQTEKSNDSNKRIVMRDYANSVGNKIANAESVLGTTFPTMGKIHRDMVQALDSNDDDKTKNEVAKLKQDVTDSLQVKKTYKILNSINELSNEAPTYNTKRDVTSFIESKRDAVLNLPLESKTMDEVVDNLNKVNDILIKDNPKSRDKLNSINSAGTSYTNINNTINSQLNTLTNFSDKLGLSKLASSGKELNNIIGNAGNLLNKVSSITKTLTCTEDLVNDKNNADIPQSAKDELQKTIDNIGTNAKVVIDGADTSLTSVSNGKSVWSDHFEKTYDIYNSNKKLLKDVSLADLYSKNQLRVDTFLRKFVSSFVSINPLETEKSNSPGTKENLDTSKDDKCLPEVMKNGICDAYDKVEGLASSVFTTTWDWIFGEDVKMNENTHLEQYLDPFGVDQYKPYWSQQETTTTPKYGPLREDTKRVAVLSSLNSQNNNAIENFANLGPKIANKKK